MAWQWAGGTLRETGRLYMDLLGAQDAGVGGGFAAGGLSHSQFLSYQTMEKTAAFMVRGAGRGLQDLCRGLSGAQDASRDGAALYRLAWCARRRCRWRLRRRGAIPLTIPVIPNDEENRCIHRAESGQEITGFM